MIQPNELKKKTFSRSVRGYTPGEVDDYIDFLIDTYTQLYKEKAETERKLHLISAKYEELANDEESIRSAVLKAQKLSEAMVTNARKKADDIVFTVEDRCRMILEDNNKKLEEEKRNLANMREMALEFRDRLYSQYLTHVKLIKEMELPSPDTIDTDLISFEDMKSRAMEGLSPKEEVMTASETSADSFTDPLEKKNADQNSDQ